MNEYYIIWVKEQNDEGVLEWRAVEITDDVQVLSGFVTETTFPAVMFERIRLDTLTFVP